MPAKHNDGLISNTVSKILHELHPNMTDGQRQRAIAAVIASAGPSRDNPSFAGVWSNVELVAMDVAAALRRDPSLTVSVPSADNLLAREVAGGGVKPEDRLTRLRQLQGMTDDERLAAQAALPADNKSADTGTAANSDEARKLVENSDAALLERVRSEVTKARPNASAQDVRNAYAVAKDRRDRDEAEKARYASEYALKGEKMSASDRLTAHRLAQAGK